jgi:mRNA interferase ChpB
MVKQTVFARGDIVRVCLNPTAGREIKGQFRPCLVLSPKQFNRLGMTLIAPITQGGNYARVEGFTVTLMGTGTDTQGVVLISGIRWLTCLHVKPLKLNQCLQKSLMKYWQF